MHRSTALSALALGVLASAPGSASAVLLNFSEPDFDWLASGGNATEYHIWTAGDFWAQDFADTGLSAATDLSLGLNVDAVGFGETLDFDIFVNDTNIGSFTLTEADLGPNQFDFSFTSIVGPSYDIEIVATQTIPFGGGSYSIIVDPLGSGSFANITPSPSSLAILVCGALTFTRRRRTQGQRTLNPLCRKDLHQELVAPDGYLALPLDAVL